MKLTNFRGQILQEVMPRKIDLIDKKILYILSQNCRVSNTALAKVLKIKREVAAYRIKQLLNDKIINGFFTFVNQRKLGFQIFKVFIKLVRVSDENKIIEELLDKKEVTIIGTCSGSFDLYFNITARSLEEFDDILNGIIQKNSHLIREYVILNIMREDSTGGSIVVGSHEETLKLLEINETKGSTFYKEFNQQQGIRSKELKISDLDEIDKKILLMLRFNARATLKEISEKVDITPNAVKTRMSRLVNDGVIKTFMPMLSYSTLGYQWYMIFLNLVGVPESKPHSYFKQHPNTLWSIKCIGPWNYQVSVFAKDNLEFHKVLDEIRNEFKDNITYFNSIMIFNQFKFEPRIE